MLLLWLQPGGQLFRGSGKPRVLRFVLEIPAKLLLQNSGLERRRKYEQRERHPGNSVCVKFRLSPPVFWWAGKGINCTYKDIYTRERSWGKAQVRRSGWEDEEKAGAMWDRDPDRVDCRACTLRGMLVEDVRRPRQEKASFCRICKYLCLGLAGALVKRMRD